MNNASVDASGTDVADLAIEDFAAAVRTNLFGRRTTTARRGLRNLTRTLAQTASIPMKRAAEPQEIAALAVFLASPDADYVTGSTYVMDGGLMQNLGQGA